MQPIIGVISDRSRSKYGRRRPFMVLGSMLVAVCLLILGWTKEIVATFIQDEEMRKSCTIALAIISIYAVDFAINAGRKLEFFARTPVDQYSSIMLPKSYCGFVAHSEAAIWVCMG